MKNLLIALLLTGLSGVKSMAAGSDPLAGVYTAYLDVKNALTRDDAFKSKAASEKLSAAVGDIKSETLTETQKKVWTKFAPRLKTDADAMKATADIAKQRKAFASFSSGFYQVIKAFGTNATDIRYQFCPMADEGRGAYWLSEDPSIRNPYLGRTMPSCGSTKQTIGAVH